MQNAEHETTITNPVRRAPYKALFYSENTHLKKEILHPTMLIDINMSLFMLNIRLL